MGARPGSPPVPAKEVRPVRKAPPARTLMPELPPRPSPRVLSVHFVGKAGVGKSTLINALVNDGYGPLPQGGVGPLTAVEVEVVNSETPRLEAVYMSAEELNEFVRRLGSGEAEERDFHLARQLVLGNPYGPFDPAELIRRLTEARMERGEQGSMAPVADGVVDCLRLIREGKRTRLERNGNPGAFAKALLRHAAGPPSPLVRKLTVGWPSEVTRAGVRLVDLPGVGVANDIYPKITRDSLRIASHVILVVDRSGIDEATINVLADSGFLARMAPAPNGPTAKLAVAVLSLDQTAEASRSVDGSRTWAQHFEASRVEARRMVWEQYKAMLLKHAPGAFSPSSEGREMIFAVLPREHQRIWAPDPEMRPFVDRLEQTYVQPLRDLLQGEAARVLGVPR